jgi:hypothetical protein
MTPRSPTRAVPDGYPGAVYAEDRGQQSATGQQFHQNRNRSGTLRRMYQSRVHSIDQSLPERLTFATG